MTVAELRPVSFSDSFGPIGWSISLVAVLLLHLAFAYYMFIYHRMEVAPPPPPPKAILIDLAPVAPLLGPKIAPLTQPMPLQPLQQPSIVPPSPPIVPPSTPVNPALAAPTPPVETAPIPDLPKLPEGEVAPLPKPAEPPPPVNKPEEKKPAQTKPVPQKQTQKTPPKQKSQQAQLPIAPSTGAMQKANPVTLWQLAVIKRLAPYMRWPDDAPYWIDTAAPQVRITIDRQGHVLRASVVQSSGYESFDKAARKIFKRALTLPPPPAELPGDPLTFNMAVTFDQRPRRIGLSELRRRGRRSRFFHSPYRAARYRPHTRRPEYP
jgi:periplasmic protein TonB